LVTEGAPLCWVCLALHGNGFRLGLCRGVGTQVLWGVGDRAFGAGQGGALAALLQRGSAEAPGVKSGRRPSQRDAQRS
jgi:hypothetical protein